jgi:hypothetical protein
MDLGLAAIAAASFFWGISDWAFWLVVAAIVSGLLDALESIVKLSWCIERGLQAGLYFNYDIRGVILTKLVATAILGCAACWLGFRAGYF